MEISSHKSGIMRAFGEAEVVGATERFLSVFIHEASP